MAEQLQRPDTASRREAGQQQAQELENRDEHKGRLFELCMPFLQENLNIAHILVWIDIKELNDIASRLLQYENVGKRKEAVRDFLEAVKDSDQPGKWQMIVDALEEARDSVVLHYLMGGDCNDPWLDKPEHRALIEVFKRPLNEHLNIKALIPEMLEKDLLLEADVTRLNAMTSNEAAQRFLIIAMQAHNKKWYKIFMTILYQDDHHRELALMIDKEFCQKVLQDGQQEEEEKTSLGSTTSDPLCGHGHSVDTGLPSSASNTSSEGHSKVPTLSILPEQDTQVKTVSQAERAAERGPGEATCTCRCCARLQAEVTALTSISTTLQAELAEIKTLLASLVASNKR